MPVKDAPWSCIEKVVRGFRSLASLPKKLTMSPLGRRHVDPPASHPPGPGALHRDTDRGDVRDGGLQRRLGPRDGPRVWQRAVQHGLAAVGESVAPAAAPPPSDGLFPFAYGFSLALSFGLVQRLAYATATVSLVQALASKPRPRAAARQRHAKQVRPVVRRQHRLAAHARLARAPGRRARRRDLRESRAVWKSPSSFDELDRRTLAMHRAFEWEEHFRFALCASSSGAPGRARRHGARDGAQVPRRRAAAVGCGAKYCRGPAASSTRAAPATRAAPPTTTDLCELELLHRDGQPAGAARLPRRREHLHRSASEVLRRCGRVRL